MNFLSFLRGLPDDGLHPGDVIEVRDDTGEVVLATYKGKGKHARGQVVVTYTQGRYTGMGQYVERERIVGKKAEPIFAHHRGWDQMEEVRKHITAAVLFTLATVGSALLYAGIVLVVSDNRTIAGLVFLVAFALALSTEVRWLRKQTARQKQGSNPIPETPMTVHGVIAHLKMYPELLPVGMTEVDLERLRKVWSEKESLAAFGDWMRQLINSTTARVHMKVTCGDPLKEARENITFATLFTLTAIGPATLIAGIILIAVSHSESLASMVFVSIFVADLLGIFWWSRRRSAPPEEQQVTVHTFVSHVKMYPELLKGRTEFDLECFRKQWNGSNQATLDAWIKQFSGETTPTSQFR